MYNIDEVIVKYDELKTLTKVAKYFNIGLETMRKFFIANNIPYQKRQKYHCNDYFFSNDNERSFYWAGFLAADGNIGKNENRIHLELSSKDKNHIEKFRNDIQLTRPISDVVKYDNRPQFKKSEYHSSKIRFNSKQMVLDLNRFGIFESKSKTFVINDYVMNSIYLKHFIRGLIDGDGWVYRKNGSTTIGLCGTPLSVSFVFNHLKSFLNLKSGVIGQRSDGLSIMSFKRLEDTSKICKYLYNDCQLFLDRKKDVADQILLCKPRKITFRIDELKKSMEKNRKEFPYYTYLAMSKEFDVSVCTIIRRLKENDLI